MHFSASQVSKFIAALVGAIAEAVNVGLVHGTALQVASIVIAFLTAITVYLVPNTPKV